ncbi:hypothetical protein GPA10_16585 [Streptomyces sp. p1417]|uniref:Uncharacterized protein n=1 Tax=Streptomyces typhae TaxID=2681492 RepID=A0A6L6WXV1_9ACTN|nr:hypothetical protein [Streptomyces typhae]MVO86333.1 hypothetical protein [Streptomyces typhae]
MRGPNAVCVAAYTLGALLELPTPALLLLGVLAGAGVPGIGPLARARVVRLARDRGADAGLVGTALSLESTTDELSFVLGPALVGLTALAGHPAYAFAVAVLLVAVCGTAFALHPTARTGRGAGPRHGAADTAGTPARRAPGCRARCTSSGPAWPSSVCCSAPAGPASPRSPRNGGRPARPVWWG